MECGRAVLPGGDDAEPETALAIPRAACDLPRVFGGKLKFRRGTKTRSGENGKSVSLTPIPFGAL